MAYEFNTYQMKFSCADAKTDKICKPSDFQKVYSPKNSDKTNYDITPYDMIEMEEGLLKFLRALPTGESEEGCIVVESVEPMIRKVFSYMMCTVAPEQVTDLTMSIKRAYYQAIVTQKLMDVAPTPGFYSERFKI